MKTTPAKLYKQGRGRERGVSLVETIAALGVFTIVGAILASILTAATGARDRVVPESRRTKARSRVYSEIAEVQASGARIWYADAQATLARAIGQIPSSETSGQTASRPPGGSGGGGGGGGAITVTSGVYETDIVQGYGAGVLVGRRLVVGPVAVWTAPILEGQTGPMVTTLRAIATPRPLRLAGPWSPSSPTIRFLASDDPSIAAAVSLTPGTVLYVNGRANDAQPVTVVVSLAAAPQVAGSSGGYTEIVAPIHPTHEPLESGLANQSRMVTEDVEIRPDATIAVLDRFAPVVSFATARREDGLKLVRVVGDPANPIEILELLDASGPLAIDVEGGGPPGDMLGPGVRDPDLTAATSFAVGVPLVGEDQTAGSQPARISCSMGGALRAGSTPVRVAVIERTSGGGR